MAFIIGLSLFPKRHSIHVVIIIEIKIFIVVLIIGHDLEEGHEVGVAGAAAVDHEVSQKVDPGK